jgi:aminopeptidase N
VNTIAANYSCKAGKITGFSLARPRQSSTRPCANSACRSPRSAWTASSYKLDERRRHLQGREDGRAGLVGAACPDLVYPNYEDWGFVKVQLDKRSFDTARASLAGVDDPLLRAMLWQSLWDGVRDGNCR